MITKFGVWFSGVIMVKIWI